MVCSRFVPNLNSLALVTLDGSRPCAAVDGQGNFNRLEGVLTGLQGVWQDPFCVGCEGRAESKVFAGTALDLYRAVSDRAMTAYA